MLKIKAFGGYLVNPERACTVVSPAYDAVSAEQRRKFSDANPDNFINTMRLRDDYPQHARPNFGELLNSNKDHLQKLLHNGSFNALPDASMFLYQLGNGAHQQTGIVCEVAVADYEKGLLRKHENTRSNKEDLLARYQEVVGASSSPICLTYAQNNAIDEYINERCATPPDLDFCTEDGESQKVWRIDDPKHLRTLHQLFSSVDKAYLTDGHHRAASGRRYAELMRQKHNSNTGDEPYNQLLVALFPDNQLNLLPFHRCVKDLNNQTIDELLNRLQKDFSVERLDNQQQFQSTTHGEFGMFVQDVWYKLQVKPTSVDQSDPVASLDVSILQDLILNPILGIKDMRDDPRLGYVAGVSGDEGLKHRYQQGWEVIFACYATSVKQLMNVADMNALMPPKSTYFDPKPRSGIFVRLK